MVGLAPILVTGAGGLIGNYVARTAPKGHVVRALSRADLDLLDKDAVRDELETHLPAVIIHCAAISKNPVCDANPELARRVNIEAVKILIDLAEDNLFVLLSTDLVFDGRKGNYGENDQPNPLSLYAETK